MARCSAMAMALLVLAGPFLQAGRAQAPAPAPSTGSPAPVTLPGPDRAYVIPPYSAGTSETTAGNIIQTADVVFSLTGPDAVPFQTDRQTLFASQLRLLLGNYNFMSVALSDYQVSKDGSSTNVTGRLALATTPQAVLRTYEGIAYGFTNQNLAQYFQGLLAQAGMDVTVQLMSLTGVPLAAAPTQADLISLALNLTAAGPMTVPFDTSVQSDVITPWTQFFGNHLQSVTINNSQEDLSNNSVNVSLAVTMLVDEVPDLWFFIFNSSEYQSALGSINPSVTVTYTGSQVEPTAALSASFAASAVAPSAAPAASSSSGSANASAGGFATGTQTVSMTLVMQILGQSILPFNQTTQANAATAMANVFGIVIGTGNVRILSSQQLGTSRHRKLLQTASIGGTPSTSSQPGVDVTYSVVLPQASQNSLLVIQSQNPQVGKQFSNWFTGQLEAEGYPNVSTSVQTFSSGVSSPGSQNGVSTASNNSGGGGSNTGAIVGGVVGGIAGLAIIGLIAALFMLRRTRKRQGMKGAMISKWVSESTTSGGFASDSAMTSNDPKMDMLADRNTQNTGSDFNPMYTMSSTEGLNTGILTTNQFNDSGHHDEIRRLLARKRRRTQAVSDTAEHDAQSALMAITGLKAGSCFQGRYIMDAGQHRGGASIVSFAKQSQAPFLPVVIKFFPDHRHYSHEKLFYENRMALESETAAEYVPTMFESLSAQKEAWMGAGDNLPPSIVLERGQCTLQDWMDGARGMPKDSERVKALHDVCKAVDFLHARNIVHRQLNPNNLMWFPAQQRWKLIDFSAWARSEEDVPLHYALRYAAPELLVADLHGAGELAANEASDMWSLGVIAFEVLTGHPLFGMHVSDEEVIGMLLGYNRLPWETDPMFFSSSLKSSAVNFIQDLLRRSPEARRPIRTAVHSPLFSQTATGGVETGFSGNSALLTGMSDN